MPDGHWASGRSQRNAAAAASASGLSSTPGLLGGEPLDDGAGPDQVLVGRTQRPVAPALARGHDADPLDVAQVPRHGVRVAQAAGHDRAATPLTAANAIDDPLGDGSTSRASSGRLPQAGRRERRALVRRAVAGQHGVDVAGQLRRRSRRRCAARPWRPARRPPSARWRSSARRPRRARRRTRRGPWRRPVPTPGRRACRSAYVVRRDRRRPVRRPRATAPPAPRARR